jgi:ribosomal protein L29
MDDASATDRWHEDRTSFQRVYDGLVGSQTFLTAQEFANRADCSERAARNALKQLSEVLIAERQDGRPVRYRRNESYVRWKRAESLAREYSPEELRERIDELITEDKSFREQYAIPYPEAVTTTDLPVDDHEGVSGRWENLNEWRTVRRDIRVLRRAVERAEMYVDNAPYG